MGKQPVVDTALRAMWTATTLRAARSFSRDAAAHPTTSSDLQYRMRAAMDLHPRVGKYLSRRTVRAHTPGMWAVADPATSRFVDPAEIDAAVAGVRKDGFYVFRKVVDSSITDALRAFAEQVPCVARGAGLPAAPYPRATPDVGRYDILEEPALACAEVQEFATDPGLALVAQRYLEQPVIMDEVAFWWTTTARSDDADLNAQLFHQDRDRLSFLKYFIYLTDVTPETGPHVYVRGTHRKLPASLRRDGRKSDDAINGAGLGSAVTELTGPAGTLMAVDTIGLHKGKTPRGGDRLALESEFATSLFGADYELPAFTPTALTKARYDRMPWVLQRYARSCSGGSH